MNAQLKAFIDTVIVPALVERFLREQAAKTGTASDARQPEAKKPTPTEEANP